MAQVHVDVEFNGVDFTYPDESIAVFTDVTLALPHGVVAFIGQNGSGKSTGLLLAGGRLVPTRGHITVLGEDSRLLDDEDRRNHAASFIYQNMEFDTDDPIGTLMESVETNGYLGAKAADLHDQLLDVLELADILDKSTQTLSKGELQRVIIAFSLLYGSRIVMMDEPIFALEEYQKERAMQFVYNYARTEGISVYYSVHELELSRAYSDWTVLFQRNKHPIVGPTVVLHERRTLEEAYDAPYDLLYHRDFLYRQGLRSRSGLSGDPQ